MIGVGELLILFEKQLGHDLFCTQSWGNWEVLCGLVGWFLLVRRGEISINIYVRFRKCQKRNHGAVIIQWIFFEWLFFVPTSGQWAATFMFGVSICEEDKKAVEGEFSLSLQPWLDCNHFCYYLHIIYCYFSCGHLKLFVAVLIVILYVNLLGCFCSMSWIFVCRKFSSF